MKLTSVLPFADVYNAIKDQKMSIRAAYKFSKLIVRTEQETEFYRTKLQEIVDTYIEKDEDGRPILVDDGNAMKIIAGKEADCGKAMQELQELEIDLEPTLHMDDLDGIELTPAQMQVLLPFVVDAD